MSEAGRTREELIKEVWPDKALYASTLLLITSMLGLIHGITFAVLDITLSQQIPALIRGWPPEAVLVLSLAEAAGAFVALRRQQVEWALGAALVGLVSMSLFGLGSVLAAIALVFVGLAHREGEDAATPEDIVPAETWPDKALAASTVLVVSGVLTLGWGLANAGEAIAFAGYMDQVIFGWICIVIGLLCLAAAALLYRQDGALVGVAAAVGSILGLALYVVGPLLGLAALYLIREAKREDEFTGPPGSGSGAAGAG